MSQKTEHSRQHRAHTGRTGNRRISTFSMVLTALMTAVTCILAPLSIPLPFSPVPITLTNLVIGFSIYLLGWKKATVSYCIYLFLGMAGLPVFSGFSGGLAGLAGPTGGYLIGFIFLAMTGGLFVSYFPQNRFMHSAGLLLGTFILYIFGTCWLAFQMDLPFAAALSIGVLPYLPGDTIKIILILILGPALKRRVNAGI